MGWMINQVTGKAEEWPEDDDHLPGDEFDWDQNDESQYCEHETFIGSPCGPDLLCHYCESGISKEEFELIKALERQRALADVAKKRLLDIVFVDIIRTFDDKIRRNPQGFGVWLSVLIVSVDNSDIKTLEEFLDG